MTTPLHCVKPSALQLCDSDPRWGLQSSSSSKTSSTRLSSAAQLMPVPTIMAERMPFNVFILLLDSFSSLSTALIWSRNLESSMSSIDCDFTTSTSASIVLDRFLFLSFATMFACSATTNARVEEASREARRPCTIVTVSFSVISGSRRLTGIRLYFWQDRDATYSSKSVSLCTCTALSTGSVASTL